MASEGGYVVGVLLSHERSDVNTLIPFMDRIHRNLSVKFSSLIADSGYESEENYQYLKDKGITAYIKPSNYELRKTKKFKSDIGKRENMTYLPEEDAFLCANKRKLIFSGVRRNKTATGFVVKKRRYSCSECEGCSLSSKCLRKAKSKNIEFSKVFNELRQESDANIKSLNVIRLRMNRSIQWEGIFAYMKEDLGYRRFRHRGKKHVENDMFLIAFAINANKLHKKIQSENLGYLEYKTA
ncbi:MAG: transposase [Clostridiaceae bacterium]|nr:transposase [Clostridiaceae bacterium]